MPEAPVKIGTLYREHYVSLPSTQDRAEMLAKTLTKPDWYLITADRQTKARATHGRSWVAPFDVNLYATYLFPFNILKKDFLLNIPQVVAYTLIEVLEKEYGFKPKLKWINDVLLNGKKIAGILCSSDMKKLQEGYCRVLAGIGLNVNMTQKDCDQVALPVTSLMLTSGQVFDKEKILNALSVRLQHNIALLSEEGFAYFVPRIESHLAFIGEKITITLDHDANVFKEGVFRGINSDGQLLLEVNGQIEALSSGRIKWY